MNIQRSKAETAYLEAFDKAGEALPSADWLKPARREARDRFASSGLPHRRVEAWRWTDLRSLLDQQFPPALTGSRESVPDGEDVSPFSSLDRHVIVFVDGHLRREMSDFAALEEDAECLFFDEGLADAPDWVTQNFGRAFADEPDPLSALNTMFLASGVAISVPSGVRIAKPLELVYINTGTQPQTLSTRALVVVGSDAELTVLETHVCTGDGRYVANNWCEVLVGDRAGVHHVKVQNESSSAVHLANTHAVVGAAASFKSICLTFGGRTTRNQIKVRFAGEGGHIGVTGSYLLSDHQHCDTALMVDHAVPECTSNELFKCVMDDHARGVFQGKIIVRPDAQKTDGMQMSQGLLLSETAEFDAKPELEIFADDVRCTHGATSGELDEDLLFYLRSRGIPAEEAKYLLIGAFIGEAIDEVEAEEIREALTAYVARLRNEARERTQ